MIPVSSTVLDTHEPIHIKQPVSDWQYQLAKGLKTANEVLQFLNIEESDLPYKIDHQSPFKTKVPRAFAQQIQSGDPYDPILLQILPRLQEQEFDSQYHEDPLEERNFSPLPGLIHKYQNRVLLIAHQSCAIHCRYCFRRNFPYSEQRLSDKAFDEIIKYIEQDSNINEVILSGGDPLNLADEKLAKIINKLEELPQLNTIRLHTRTPVTLPARLTKQLLATLQQARKTIVIVFHINHPQELSEEFRVQLQQLKHSNITLLNQSVLLKQVNDHSDILIQLSESLFSYGILPYYLHRQDNVSGTQHFKVSEEQAQKIWNNMQSQLSGYLLPKLVQEIPNRTSKTWVNK